MRTFVAGAILSAATLGGALAEPAPACGGFVGPSRFAMPELPTGFATADFNLDGLPDVVELSQNTISVRLGDPAAGLGEALRTRPAVQFSNELVAGDFDGGAPDVITVDFWGSVRFFHGNGDGTFADPVDAGYASGQGVLVAVDVDGDGKLDLAYAGNGGGLSVRLGRGDGTFEDPVVTPLDTFVNSLVFGDVDGDGKPDVIVGGFYQGGLLVLLGNGDGTFGPPTVLDETNTWSGLVLADFDGDGRLDLVGMQSYRTLEFLHGNGDGTFGAPVSSTLAVIPASLLAADLDGDGVLDLIAPLTDGYSSSGGGLQVLMGRGDGTFVAGSSYATDSGGALAAPGDFDGDGLLDVVLASVSTPEVWWLRGRGDGTLHGTPTALFGAPSALLASGDFDEDGRTDLAGAGYDPATSFSSATVALGRASQQFVIINLEPTNRFLQSVAVGDFHDSGHLDLAYFSLFNGTTAISLFQGHGDGTFGYEQLQPLTLAPANQAYPMVAGRFGTDSHLDLVLAAWDSVALLDSILLLRGDGNGGFSTQTAATMGVAVSAMAAADFDGDGLLDLAVVAGGFPSGVLRILHGDPDGTFTISAPYAVGLNPSFALAADIDGDGALDLLVGDYSASSILILRGDGHGGFAPGYGVGVGAPTTVGAVADVNGDGIPDLLATGFGGRVELLRGYGDGTFAAPQAWVIGAYSYSLVTGDFDGDGRVDAAASNGGPFQGSVAVLWNERVTAVTVAPASALLGQAAILHAQGGGAAATGYQWMRDGTVLSDGGSISGSQTPTLTIDPVSFADVGSYEVVVTDGCGSTTSNPADLTVEFADVPTFSPFHADILTIATAGITGGCGGSNYCPSSPVRRDQMAAFLLKAEHGSGYLPPACSGVFADVPCPSSFADWIEELAAEGVTSGCGGNNYCPDSSVTRAQMAVFLLKTRNGSGYAPPTAVGIFGDVPVGSFGADFIEALYNQGITGGCQVSPLLYCPGNSVLRQQMATFLVRTFGLP